MLLVAKRKKTIPIRVRQSEQWTTATAAPLASPHTAEPGPGTWTLLDTTSKYSIANGRLQIAQGANATYTDPNMYSSASVVTGAPVGTAIYCRTEMFDTNYNGGFWGLTNNTNITNVTPAAAFAVNMAYNNVLPQTIDHGYLLGVANLVYSATNPLAIDTLCVYRAPGVFYLQRIRPGAPWTLVWVDHTNSSNNFYLRINGNRPYLMDEIGVYDQLPAAWSDRNGIATARLATSSAASTQAMTVDAIVEHTITAATGVTQDVMFRRVDDNNCWLVRMDQAGSTFKLFEKVAGVETQRATIAQTWTNGSTYRISVACEAYHIRAYIANTPKLDYTSARTNLTGTTAKVTAAGTEFTCWPRHINLGIGTPSTTNSFFPYGDSKTAGQGDTTASPNAGYPDFLAANLTAATGNTWREYPKKIGHSGFTTAQARTVVDADLATLYPDRPDAILWNLSVNDFITGNDADGYAQWRVDAGYILDTFQAKWPGVTTYMMRPWKAGFDTNANAMAASIDTLITSRTDLKYGPDERVFLKGSDNGASETVDGIHPTHATYQVVAAQWQTALGH